VAQQRRGLGRGLGALIPAGQGSLPPASAVGTTPGHDHEGPGGGVAAGAYFDEVLIGAVTPNPRQPRQNFDEDTITELAMSVREVGLLQPIVVRKVMPGHYEIVMGERRWRAAQQAGLERVPAIVRDTADTDMLRDALLENLHREQLNPLEEAAAYQQLLDDFGATHEELAGRVGRSRPHISNTIRLLNLPPAVQKRVAAGVLSAGHARALLTVEDAGEQERLAHRIVAEGLSVRAVEEIVAVGDGSSAKPERRQAAKRPVAPGLRELSDRLSDLFETRVKVELGRRKGKIVVEFASLDDLERIVTAMSPEAAVRGGRAPQPERPLAGEATLAP
jgi:ParB family transcriptional regulator, chromosome partitioning protein